MSFASRYETLNPAQRTAVDTIDGPLMVIAGPGTGKTELLSMRAANILKNTDVLPNNILCLTFTESGAQSMRERLHSIIGKDAYKVAIHTFHSFGTETINRYREYFYNGANFQPASEPDIYEILHGIFETLRYDNPLSTKMNDEFVYLHDVLSAISELKKSSLTSDELLSLLSANEYVLDELESDLAEIFSMRLSKKSITLLQPLVEKSLGLTSESLPASVTPLHESFSRSLAIALLDAETQNSTKPVTAWRNIWLEKNSTGRFVFKDRKRTEKLRALTSIYHQYVSSMQHQSLYDFDDMVLETVHALEINDELRFNLQEQYLYIMVDEFQDTNLAQSRLLRGLTNNPANEGKPNIMVVGDDDQAIYSFQGAEISNILEFQTVYRSATQIVLKDNYRSTGMILDAARAVITQGQERLERYLPSLNKTLQPHKTSATNVAINEFNDLADERLWIAKSVKTDIENGVKPSEITVIARRHHELVSLLPYFSHFDIPLNYERRENVLESDVVQQLELLARIICALMSGDHDFADSLLPKLLAHPAWNIAAEDLWKLSMTASRNHSSWMEQMAIMPKFQTVQIWIITQAKLAHTTALEPQLDALLGIREEDEADFRSPLYNYYFSSEAQENNFDAYLTFLEALRTIRDKLREQSSEKTLYLQDFLEYIDLQRELGTAITAIRRRSSESANHVNLMTAHKSKGMEFDHVYLCGAVDSSWGARVRTRSRLISYPENLPIAPAGDSYDERLRLFFVAMTRARTHLHISYSRANDSGAALELASFLSDSEITRHAPPESMKPIELVAESRLAWQQSAAAITPHSAKELLAPILERYKLSATHLNAFLDVTRGGPQFFLTQNLLRFPQAMSPNAAYGSAVHKTLQHAHQFFSRVKTHQPIEDILTDFEQNLKQAHLPKDVHDTFAERGAEYLGTFFAAKYDSFAASQQTELGFGAQQSMVGAARLTGSLDLVDIDRANKTLAIIDYKTGKPSESWRGKTDYEKIKLHKYKQQLMFYHLLVANSKDYSQYQIARASLQFVEPTTSGLIVELDTEINDDELTEFSRLTEAVWQKIISADFPDTSMYPQNYSGMLEFENWLREH